MCCLNLKNLIGYFSNHVYREKNTGLVVVDLMDFPVLRGKKGIITGGSSGIGFAIARRCIECGACVVITGRNERNLQNAVNELNEIELDSASYVISDLSEITVDEATKLFNSKGYMDFLVNNAGISIQSLFPDVRDNDYENILNTNLRSHVIMADSYIKKLDEKGCKGNIVNIASTSGMAGITYPYGISKSGMVGFTKYIAGRYADTVRCNAVSPDITVSNITQWSRFDPHGNLYNKSARKRRTYRAEEIAEIVLFLLSDDSEIVNGQVFTCDNGGVLAVSSAG